MNANGSGGVASRFVRQNRPQVAPRVDEMGAAVAASSVSQPQPTPATQPVEPDPVAASPGGEIDQLKKELENSPPIENLQLRFELPYKEAIIQAARDAGVTPETLLQAAWEVSQRYSHIAAEVNTEAAIHYKRRKRIQSIKRTITSIQTALKGS